MTDHDTPIQPISDEEDDSWIDDMSSRECGKALRSAYAESAGLRTERDAAFEARDAAEGDNESLRKTVCNLNQELKSANTACQQEQADHRKAHGEWAAERDALRERCSVLDGIQGQLLDMTLSRDALAAECERMRGLLIEAADECDALDDALSFEHGGDGGNTDLGKRLRHAAGGASSSPLADQ